MTSSHDEIPEVALVPAIPRVQVGCRVEVELLSESGEAENAAFDVVPDKQADFAAGFLGAGTPLGQAIMGRAAGSSVPYHVADIVEVRIRSVSRSARSADEAAAEARRAATQAAEERAKTDEMVQLALTVNVKWGGYDPEPLESSLLESGATKVAAKEPAASCRPAPTGPASVQTDARRGSAH